MNYNNAKEQFEKYLNSYDRDNGKVRLKIIHTYGVVHDMTEICKRMQLSDEDTELARIIALLHDIGRHLQYTQNIPHDEAGAQLAEIIMADCGFSSAERAEITQAILQHRGDGDRSRDGLAALLYRADKASRMCLFCAAEPECNWSPEKKNMTLQA